MATGFQISSPSRYQTPIAGLSRINQAKLQNQYQLENLEARKPFFRGITTRDIGGSVTSRAGDPDYRNRLKLWEQSMDRLRGAQLELDKKQQEAQDITSGNYSSNIGSVADYSSQFGFDELGYLPAEIRALGDVEEEFKGAEQRETRELSRYGINPSSGRGRGSRQRRAMNLALARVGARLEARKGIDDQNYQRQLAGAELGLKARGQDINRDISDRKLRLDALNF
jgi:hypothetical protein